MSGINVEAFKRECMAYLAKVNINILRSYGRILQLRTPTKMKKRELVEGITCILCGEYSEERNGKRGAPIKGECVTKEFLDDIDALVGLYLYGDEPQVVEDPLKMQFTVELTQLTDEQKQLLVAFLNSL